MKDINLDGLSNIKADKELIEKTVNKVMNNNKSKNYFNIKKSIAVAASLLMISGLVSFYSLYNRADLGKGAASNPIADNNVTANNPVADNNVTPNKPVANSNVTPNNSVENNNITPNKSVADNNVNPNSLVGNSNVAPSKSSGDNNITPNKSEGDNNVTPNKPVENSNISSYRSLMNNNGIIIPAIILNVKDGVSAKMFALVVYKSKIYTESSTQLDSTNIKNLLGEKIGRTINSIDEWNVKAKSSEELPSNIGEQDIYTVKGYNEDFRIMSYFKIKDQEYAQFFDCLNGITVKSGKDIFGKLNLVDNIESAKFVTFDNWNNGIDGYVKFEDINLLNEVSRDLISAVPYNYKTVEKDIDSSKNNNEFREFTLKLKDGLELKLTAFKKGYVSYGYSNVYFKVESSVIDKLW